jgi:mono/diheme cytochrome c family protein
MRTRRSPAAAFVLVLAAVSLAACGGESGGGPLDVGRGVYGDMCSTCHGDAGQGGTGPALGETDVVFPACGDQIEWVTLGSDRWQEAYGDTYGATDKPVQGGMPSMEDRFTAEEIAAVVLYERVEYGGLSPEEAAADCGITLPPTTAD